MTITTCIGTWAADWQGCYDPDPNNMLGLSKHNREGLLDACKARLCEAIDAALEPWGIYVLGNGDLIGEWRADRPTEPEWEDIRESVSMIEFDALIAYWHGRELAESELVAA